MKIWSRKSNMVVGWRFTSTIYLVFSTREALVVLGRQKKASGGRILRIPCSFPCSPQLADIVPRLRDHRINALLGIGR